MPPVQQIYTDNPGAIANAVFELPPGLDLDLQSVRAKISGAGAAGTFIVVCEIVTSDGKILAQSPIDQSFAVGDTGALTWAPFLRGQAAATPSGGGQPIRTCRLVADLVAPAASVTVPWDSFLRNNAVFSTSATSGGAPNNTAGDKFLRIAGQGFLWVMVGVTWTTPTVGQTVKFNSTPYSVVREDFSGRAVITDAANESWTAAEECMFVTDAGTPEYISVVVSGTAGSNCSIDLRAWSMAADDEAVVY